MPYIPGQAQSNLESDGVRRFTEEELRNIARVFAENETTFGSLSTRVGSLETRTTALEGRMTAAEAATTALTTRVGALETWKTSIDTLPVLSVQLLTQHATTASTYYPVLFDTVVFDTIGGWDSINRRYRPGRAGYYMFSWVIYAANSVSMTRCLSRFSKNGAAYTYGSDYATSNSIGMTTGAALLFFNGSSDYVTLEIFIAAATPICGTSTSAQGLVMMNGQWVRP